MLIDRVDNRPDTSFTNPSSKLSLHPEHLRNLLEGRPAIPISIEVDLTYICGDNCGFCHFAYTHESKLKTQDGEWDTTKIMTPEVANIVFEKLANAGVKSIVFSGGGEPLDSPLALEVFKIAKSNELELGMYTRGYGLKDEIADYVAENFEWVVVSLDVTSGEDHEKVKGTSKKVFERKVNNVLAFTRKPNRHANISVSCMVGPQHLELVDPYPSQEEFFGNTQITKLERDMLWMLNLDTDEVQIRPIVDTGTYHEQRQDHHMHGLAYKSSEEMWQEHYAHIPQIKTVLEKYNSLHRLRISIDKFDDLYNGISGYGNCKAMFVSAGLVRTDGIVDKCVNTRKITPIGNLMTQSVEEIYLNPNLDTAVDGNCRGGCRGCKVNNIFHGMENIPHKNFL